VEYSLKAGLHVICEKPISVTAETGQQMVDLALAANKVTAINLPLLYSESVDQIAIWLQQKYLGEIRKIILKFRYPQWPRKWQDVEWLKTKEQGGPIREIVTHFIYLVYYLFGEMEIQSSRNSRAQPDGYEHSLSSVFTVGAIPGLIDLETDVNEPEENSLILVGKEKSTRFSSWHRLEVLNKGKYEIFMEDSSNSSLQLVAEFVKQLNRKNGNLTSFEVATWVQGVIDILVS